MLSIILNQVSEPSSNGFMIGYDDHTEEDIAVMRAKENYYLSQRGNV